MKEVVDKNVKKWLSDCSIQLLSLTLPQNRVYVFSMYRVHTDRINLLFLCVLMSKYKDKEKRWNLPTM